MYSILIFSLTRCTRYHLPDWHWPYVQRSLRDWISVGVWSLGTVGIFFMTSDMSGGLISERKSMNVLTLYPHTNHNNTSYKPGNINILMFGLMFVQGHIWYRDFNGENPPHILKMKKRRAQFSGGGAFNTNNVHNLINCRGVTHNNDENWGGGGKTTKQEWKHQKPTERPPKSVYRNHKEELMNL